MQPNTDTNGKVVDMKQPQPPAEKPVELDYSKPDVIAKQIKLLETELRQFELQVCEQLSRRRGMLEGLLMIQGKKEIVSIQKAAAAAPGDEPPPPGDA